jgi:hypothetical protein
MERKRYKILMITTGFAPYEFSEAIVNSKLVLALKNAGHYVDVISRESQQVYSIGWSKIWEPLRASTYFVSDQKVSIIQRVTELIYSLFYFRYPIYGIRWGVKVSRLALKMYKNKHYDILLTRMPSMIPHLIGKKIHNKIGIPWIANWNDPTDNIRPLLEDRNLIKSFLNNLLVKDIFDHASFNTYPSEDLWEHFNLKILHTTDKYVEIIPHIGIELNLKSKTNTTLTQSFDMCHAGNMLSNVDARPLMQALLKLKQSDNSNFRFHVFGSVNGSFPKLIKEFHLEENIICRNPLDYESMLSELQKYDVLVLLEAQYEKGILLLSKLSDYASVGKPVLCVSPKTGIIADYINKYGGGLAVNNKDSESIYYGLKVLMDEWTNEWPNKRLSTTQYLFGKFKPDVIVKKYELLFQKVTNP